MTLGLRKMGRTHLQTVFPFLADTKFSGKNLFVSGGKKKKSQELSKSLLKKISKSEIYFQKWNICCALHRPPERCESLWVLNRIPYLNQALPFQTSLLLGLLVQLHVRHQDVLLRLLRQAGIGAAVASAFIGPPGPDGSPSVQVDDDRDQRHQDQGRHQDDDQRGQVIVGHWGGGETQTRFLFCSWLKSRNFVRNLLVTSSVSATANRRGDTLLHLIFESFHGCWPVWPEWTWS